MKYTNSIKKRFVELSKFDFDRGIEVVILRNQGWTLEQCGKKMGISRERVRQIEKMMNGLDVETAELVRDIVDRASLVIDA